MFKTKNMGINLEHNDANITTRLHDGPVFKVTHPNSEPIKRSVMYACRGFRMEQLRCRG